MNGYDRKRRNLLGASMVCFALFFAGLLFLAYGCAVRHLPGGMTAPATKFEGILAWNAAAALANDGFADNVIALQRGGSLSITQARTILLKQGAIAQADRRITERISAAALCATEKLGANAAPAAIDQAAADCAKISGPGLAADVNLILATVTDLNNSGLLAVKDPTERQALSGLLANVEGLVQRIYSTLESQGVIQ